MEESYLPFHIKKLETMWRNYWQSVTLSQNGTRKVLLVSQKFNCGLKRGKVFQIVRFNFHLSVIICTQLWKYFQSMVLGGAGRDCCNKNRVLEFLVDIFWLCSLSVFNYYMRHGLTIPCLLSLSLYELLSY